MPPPVRRTRQDRRQNAGAAWQYDRWTSNASSSRVSSIVFCLTGAWAGSASTGAFSLLRQRGLRSRFRRDRWRQVLDPRIHFLGKQRHTSDRALVIEVAGLLHHHQVIEAADLVVEFADARRDLVGRARDQDTLLHHVI